MEHNSGEFSSGYENCGFCGARIQYFERVVKLGKELDEYITKHQIGEIELGYECDKLSDNRIRIYYRENTYKS